MNIRPPKVKQDWNEIDVETQAALIAYNNLREYEESQDRLQLYRVLGAKIT
jgi:hypothetical protein